MVSRTTHLRNVMKIYGVLIIGCGHIGLEHLNEIYYRDNIKIVATVDTDIEAARVAARRAGCDKYSTDYRDFLKLDEVDIVIIATYTSSHLDILKDALSHKKHVLCEKPIAVTLAEGEEFIRVAKSSQNKVLIAHILRHNAAYNLMRKLILGGEIGEVKVIRMVQNHHTLKWERYQRLMEDCSPTVDCGVHYYDVAEWITGAQITEVAGFGIKMQGDAPRENYTMVNFKMDNGCIGYYEAGWGQTIRSANVKEFIGTEGRITLELRDRRVNDNEEGDLITVYKKKSNTYETLNVKGRYKNMYAQISTLIDMIENGGDGNPTLDEAFRSFKISVLAEESIKTGKVKPVKI